MLHVIGVYCEMLSPSHFDPIAFPTPPDFHSVTVGLKPGSNSSNRSILSSILSTLGGTSCGELNDNVFSNDNTNTKHFIIHQKPHEGHRIHRKKHERFDNLDDERERLGFSPVTQHSVVTLIMAVMPSHYTGESACCSELTETSTTFTPRYVH